MKFRSRRIDIDAIQWDGKNTAEVREWATQLQSDVMPDYAATVFVTRNQGGDTQAWNNIKDPRWGADIRAAVYDYLHETWVGVRRNDHIIFGTKREFYPCNDDVFKMKYVSTSDESEVDMSTAAVLAQYGVDWQQEPIQDVLKVALRF